MDEEKRIEETTAEAPVEQNSAEKDQTPEENKTPRKKIRKRRKLPLGAR